MSQLDADIKASALEFIRGYAVSHQFFTGGDILASYRESGHQGPASGWRNVWAALVCEGHRRGWYVKAGRVVPTSHQSHTGSLTQWHSKIFTGVQALTGTTDSDQLEAIRRDLVTRKIDVRKALWKAYELGLESSGGNPE